MNLKALTFLRAILPETGVYVAWSKAGKRSYNTCRHSIEDLCAFILQEDALGRTVYHACASFMSAEGVWNARKEKFEVRSQANSYGARSLWLDIDGGPDAVKKGTGYATAQEGAAAVTAYCFATGLPLPWYVASGSGIHAYWPFDQTLGHHDWLRFASGLKASARAHGLLADPTRTADIASVLRTPGTHNRKTGMNIEVLCGEPHGPYPLNSLNQLLEYADAPAERQLPTEQHREASATVQSLIDAGSAPPAYAENVASGCAHIAALRDTRGNLPEPLWYAGLGVLAWCVDGSDAAHRWSSGYAGYTAVETNARLQRVLTLTGATTCAKFESLDHAKCAACPHRGRIKSPISLGARGAERSERGTASLSAETSQEKFQSLSPSTGEEPATTAASNNGSGWQLPRLPLPWKWSRRNQLVMEMEKDDLSFELVISEYPIFLQGVQTGEIRKDKFSYHFHQWLPHAGWIDIHLSASELFGSSGISKLFGGGAVIHEPKAFMKYVEHAVVAYNAQWKLRMRYEQFGWKEDGNAFLYGSTLYKADTAETVIGSDEIKTRCQSLAPAAQGSLDQWSNAANSLFQLGCEAQSFALLCSFASTLTAFHTDNEGGAIVSLVTSKSGKGKTTTLAGVESVWSKHKGLGLTNIDTAVSKGLTLGVLGNLPVVYDELWDRDPQVVRDFVLMFTNGRDKMRGTRDGEIKHTSAQWQTLLISAANLSLVELLDRTSAVDAPGMRVLEFGLTLPDHIVHSRGDRLQKAMYANCGHAGDAFLRYLLDPEVLAWARQALLQWTDEIWSKTGLRAEHRFWVRTLGSVAVAAKLVTELGILAFQPSRVVEWAMTEMSRRKDVGLISGRPATGVDVITEYMSEHIADTLVMPDRFQPGRGGALAILKPTRRLHIRYEVKPGRILLAESPLKKWMVDRGCNYRETIDELVESKVITRQRVYATLSAGTDYPGGQVITVEVDARHPRVSGVLAEVVQTTMLADGLPLGARSPAV